MEIPFGYGDYSSNLLIFFFHGLLFTLLVLRNGILYKSRASYLLALLLFLCTLYIMPYMLGYAGWYGCCWTRETLFFVPFMQVLLIGPVVYFYTKSLLNRDYKISKKEYFHFIPAILYGIYSLIVFVTDKLILDEYYFYADQRDKDLADWYQAAGLISMGVYLVLSLRYYASYRKLIYDQLSYADTILFKWIRNFLIAFLLLLLLRLTLFIVNSGWGDFGSQYWYYKYFSWVFLYISVSGYANAIKQAALGAEKLNPINVFEEETVTEEEEVKPSMGETEILQWKSSLEHTMTKKELFKNPRLTLRDVAQELETTTKNISAIVNSGYEMNFNDFVNHYRIEAIKKKLEDGEHLRTTLLGIAYDAGFNSKATFNRAFKKYTTLSPKEYLTQLQEN
ncbi:helix-turn-helix domain-containing protein [Aureicoccus marinus]|uniref:AraC family transcriptional regulator n=1 Tax=Aureicoccus marinus TaxID=754435 RepID=A0A2S7T7E8_9FLAO|nr:AraC family transcriptional regulator [Aureicoccus marinus]PQJ15376.1 AraC family transcriptional regulator [Aureicoccus marinus]